MIKLRVDYWVSRFVLNLNEKNEVKFGGLKGMMYFCKSNIKYRLCMKISSDNFTVRAIRVSECMLNAAEDLASNQSREADLSKRGVIAFSPSYSVRFENDEVMLFSSITRFLVWIPIVGYNFLKDHENETIESVISVYTDENDSQTLRKFFSELNRYGVLSAA